MSKAKPVSDLEDHLGYWLRGVSNLVSQAFQRKVEAQGVTVAEWVVLRAIFAADTLNPSQLAEQLGMTRGAVSKLVDRVALKGLVLVTAETADRRFQSLKLTATGRKLVPVLAALADANDHEFFGVLSAAQQASLRTLLRELADQHGVHRPPVD